MSARVRTEAHKLATKRKRAENPPATKKASLKWYYNNPAKVRAYREAHSDEIQKSHALDSERVSIRTDCSSVVTDVSVAEVGRTPIRSTIDQEQEERQ